MSTEAMREASSESIQADRDTLRTLLVVSLTLVACYFLAMFFCRVPDGVQMALALEEEMASDSVSGIFAIAAIALLVTLVWAYVDLWRYRRQGVTKLAAVVFVPVLLLQTSPACVLPLVEYLGVISNVVTGMILFHCWTSPELFDELETAAAGAVTAPGVNASPSSAAGGSATASPAR
jgi:hypothetical protein